MISAEVQAAHPVTGWRTGHAVLLQRLDSSAARSYQSSLSVEE